MVALKNLPSQISISKISLFFEYRLTWDFLGFLSSVLDNLAFPLFLITYPTVEKRSCQVNGWVFQLHDYLMSDRITP